MSHRQPSLARRIFPAFALTTVGVGIVHSLHRPVIVGAFAVDAPSVDPLPTTVVPPATNPPAPSATKTPATNAPAPPATNPPAAPVTNVCGAFTGTGSPATIKWRRDYGVVHVIAQFKTDGTLCKATAQYQTYDNKSKRYEAYAIPILNKQATNAGNAKIQGVSGATAVSRAYAQSLQSAIDHKA